MDEYQNAVLHRLHELVEQAASCRVALDELVAQGRQRAEMAATMLRPAAPAAPAKPDLAALLPQLLAARQPAAAPAPALGAAELQLLQALLAGQGGGGR